MLPSAGEHVRVKPHGASPRGQETHPGGQMGVCGREAEDKVEEASLVGRVKRPRQKNVDLGGWVGGGGGYGRK